ncbi:excinuclease ABC, C subunit domain protein [gamma proteobacterium HTCC5015]|nr:excinuclease ABC, C subunit domain protein [gamma proteobacterium HTCC5015]
MSSKAWWVYSLLCADNTLYTGITTDPQKRLKEHNESPKGARYTRSRRPVQLCYLEAAPHRSAASQREAALKKLARHHKCSVIRAAWNDTQQLAKQCHLSPELCATIKAIEE